MITVEVYKDGIHDNHGKSIPSFYLSTFNKITIVLGDSGSGKSHFFSTLNLAIGGVYPWSFKCTDSNNNIVPVIMIDNIVTLQSLMDSNINSVMVLDEDATQLVKKNNLLSKIEKSKNYFILLDRDFKTKIQINIAAVLKAERHTFKGEKIIEFKPLVKMCKQDITEDISKKITYLVTEDTKSGKIFWEKVFTNINIYTSNTPGNSGIKDAIIELLVNQKIQGDMLIALDYDRGSKEISDIQECEQIDKSRIHFIPLESFEEVICNSELVLSQYPQMIDLVINYKDHINALHQSTGKYFGSLLFTFVKQAPPIKRKGNRNREKFYEKGDIHFESCFINNCCDYNRNTTCKLNYNGNKKLAMLANKFEQYRIFVTGI